LDSTFFVLTTDFTYEGGIVMRTVARGPDITRYAWIVSAAAAISMVIGSSAWANEMRKTIGISPLVSNVPDVSAEAAEELLVNALLRTNRFSIKPPDAKGAFKGVQYVLEPTISEGKAKTNVLGFLKDTVVAAPVSLDVRVFDPNTATMVSMVTVNSADIKSEKVGLADISSMMGAVGVNAGQQPSESLKLEERLGGIMLHAANRLANQLGATGSGMQRAAGSPRTPYTR